MYFIEERGHKMQLGCPEAQHEETFHVDHQGQEGINSVCDNTEQHHIAREFDNPQHEWHSDLQECIG